LNKNTKFQDEKLDENEKDEEKLDDKKALGGFPENLKDDKWTSIGFQRNDPRTDFRGGGIFSLRALIYFISKYRQKWDEILEYV